MLAGVVQAAAQDTTPLYQVGGVDIRPRANYSLVYDDNIFLENKDKAINGKGNAGRDHDWISTIKPGLRLNAGDVAQREASYFDANYDASIIRFASYTGADAVDHNGSVELGTKLGSMGLKLNQALSSFSDASQQTLAANARVKRKIWDTKASAEYTVSEKTSASLEFAQSINDYPAVNFVDSVDRSGAVWLDYQMLPKLRVGLGGGGGYQQIDNTATTVNPNSVYYNGKLRMDWRATDKLTVRANGGLEERHYQGVNLDRLGLVFGVTADWRAGEKTTVTLSAQRGQKPSNSNGDTSNEETSLTLGIKHRLVDQWTISLDSGYSFSHYTATQSGQPVSVGAIRNDEYYYLKPGVAYRFAERAQASVFYQYRRNNSDLANNGNDFYNNQLGVELSYRF